MMRTNGVKRRPMPHLTHRGNVLAILGVMGVLAAWKLPAEETRTTIRLRRAPVAMIGEDSYPTIGSGAVDPPRNEIVVAAPHVAKILVYDRLANTPPTAAMSEPKRILEGGKTMVDRNCGLYIDPKSGDL